jgi:hypothetical protein
MQIGTVTRFMRFILEFETRLEFGVGTLWLDWIVLKRHRMLKQYPIPAIQFGGDMQFTPDGVKNTYSGRRCFNKKTGKIGYLTTEKVKEGKGKLYCFNVDGGKLDKLTTAGQRVTVEEIWNLEDVTIMENK